MRALAIDRSWLGPALCLAGAALGAAALVGWLLDIAVVTTFVAGRPAMVPNTAVAVLLLGAAAAMMPPPESERRARLVVTCAFASMALVIGVGTLAEYAFSISLGLDRVLIGVIGPMAYPRRPAPFTAMALTLLAAALLSRRWQVGARHPAEWLLLGAAFLAFVSLVAHLYGASAIYQLRTAPGIGVSVPTAVALLLVSAGALLPPPQGGLRPVITSTGPGGQLFKRVGASALVGTPILGLLLHRALLAAGVADVPLALALMTSVGVLMALSVLATTARRIDRAHRALEASREQARTFIEDSADGFFVADLDGRYTFVNAAGCALLGSSREEILGRTILDLIPSSEAARLADAKAQLFAGRTHTAEWHLKRRDGSYVPVEVNAKILADGRWQGLVRDITRRKAAERAARRSEARLEGIISIAADAIISIDGEQRIVMYNQGAARIFGWSCAEAIGRPLDLLIPERLAAAHHEHVLAFGREEVSSRMMKSRTAVVGRRKNGEEFPAEAAISRLTIDGEQTFTVNLRDVTEAMRLQDELRATLERLQTATRLKDEMLHVVAHDLRSPLSAALLAASLLVREVPEDRREASRRAAERIDRSIRRAIRLVDDLLDTARIDNGALELRLGAVPPETLIADAIDAFQALAGRASIRLEWDVDPGLPLVIADRDRMAQVFGNLLDNALKFTPADGRIRVTAARAGDMIRFAVLDTGQGIAAEDLRHVFDRFWQSAESRHGGAGLGLAIAKGIVEAHGGRISAESPVGAGASFAFTLPVEANA